MKYEVILLENSFYKWEIDASDADEAEYIARQFNLLNSEREECLIRKEVVIYSFLDSK